MNLEILSKSVEYPERIPSMKFIKKLINIHEYDQMVVNIEADSSICYRYYEADHQAEDYLQVKKGKNFNSQYFRYGEEGHIRQDYNNLSIQRCLLYCKFSHTKSRYPTVNKLILQCNKYFR